MSSAAQQPVQHPIPAETQPQSTRTVPPEVADNYTLPVSGQGSLQVELVPADAMTQADKDLVAKAEPELRRRAAFEALPLDQPGWIVQQLACSAFPDTLLLRYERDQVSRQASMFSAAISRHDSSVRVIPLARKGYSLFSPAPVNSASVAAVNRMLAHQSAKPSLGAIGICYAALTGSAAQRDPNGKLFVRLAGAPVVHLGTGGEEQLAITTTGAPAQRWNLNFGRHGTLVKASSDGADSSVMKPAPAGKEPLIHAVPPPKN